MMYFLEYLMENSAKNMKYYNIYWNFAAKRRKNYWNKLLEFRREAAKKILELANP